MTVRDSRPLRQDFDAGDPPRRREDRELDEMPGRLVTPAQDDPEAARDVVGWLVRLLGRPAER